MEAFRVLEERAVTVRAVDAPLLVLGSTQQPDVVAADLARAAGVAVVQRRSGGGAVLVGPADTLWIDAWVPRDDPLWVPDVVSAAAWVGEWWRGSLFPGSSVPGAEVHRGPLVARPWSDLVCFAGRGPGEVLVAGRKVVGVAQWRSRQGALFSTAAYRRWDPGPLCALLQVGEGERVAMAAGLATEAAGVEDLAGPSPGAQPVAWERLVDELLRRLPGPAAWRRVPG